MIELMTIQIVIEVCVEQFSLCLNSLLLNEHIIGQFSKPTLTIILKHYYYKLHTN